MPFKYGPSTEKQIHNSFNNAINREYSMLILGNSRIYRGINPDRFSIKCYNFAHDDDSYNQMYYKLLFVHNKKEIKKLILGVDYFSFSFISNRRNYIYGGLLGHEYLKDFYAFDNNLAVKILFFFDSKKQDLNNFLGFNRTKLLIKSILSLRRNNKLPFQRDNGQYIFNDKPKIDDSITRDFEMKLLQKSYFEKIIFYCKKNKIQLYLLMPPLRDNEIDKYPIEIIEKYDLYFSKFDSVKFINFSKSNKFNWNDYTDITHLNEFSADRFSSLINEEI